MLHTIALIACLWLSSPNQPAHQSGATVQYRISPNHVITVNNVEFVQYGTPHVYGQYAGGYACVVRTDQILISGQTLPYTTTYEQCGDQWSLHTTDIYGDTVDW